MTDPGPTNRDLRQRLNAARIYAGHADVAKFAKELDVPKDTYIKYEASDATSEPIPATVLLRFIVLTRVSLRYLYSGGTPMFDYSRVI